MSLARDDDDQELGGLALELPKGLLADLSDVALCPQDNANQGTCGPESLIGKVVTGAGPGLFPFVLEGRSYLTGPHNGGPFGLSIVVPAIAGPFDLGNVVVRAALRIDPTTAQARIITDPLPEVLEGIRLQVRFVRATVDRPDFMINPTNCHPQQVRATITSTAKDTTNAASRFRIGNCAGLAFTPKLKLRLTGKKQTKTAKHPGVRAQLTQPPDQAAIKKAIVRLPKALALDPDNARALCEFDDATKPDPENHCPKGSIVGRAKATTPLLKRPLTGNVYFAKNVRIDKRTGNPIRTLPMLVAALRGQIAINLRGTSSTTKDGTLVNTFKGVPDAPIKQFNLNIHGGNNGILTVTRTAKSRINLCTKPNSHLANVDMDGHNGKRRNLAIRVKTPCATNAKRKARR